MRKEVKDLTE